MNKPLDKNTKLWTKNFTIITLINFFLFFSFQLFPSALPPYLKSLGAEDNLLGWIQGIVTIATLIIRPFSGLALDRYGRKGVFIIGTIGMMAATAAYSFFPVVSIILIIRFAHGIVWGIANTACSTLASDNVEKQRFSQGMGYFSLASSVAMAIAPAVALSIGVQSSVILAVGFLLLTFILIFFITYSNDIQPRQKTTKKVAFYEKESIIPAIIMLLMNITFGAILTFLALYGKQKSIEGVSLFFTVYAVSMLITRPFLGKLIDNKGFGAGIWPGVILMPISLILLSLTNNLTTLLISATLYGIGIGAAQSSLQTMAIINVSKNRIGAANSTFFTGFDAGIGLGAVISGIITSRLSYGNMFAVMAVFPLLAGLLYLLFNKKTI